MGVDGFVDLFREQVLTMESALYLESSLWIVHLTYVEYTPTRNSCIFVEEEISLVLFLFII